MDYRVYYSGGPLDGSDFASTISGIRTVILRQHEGVSPESMAIYVYESDRKSDGTITRVYKYLRTENIKDAVEYLERNARSLSGQSEL